MQTRVQKWGNSLAIRIPKHLADEMGIKDASEVDLLLSDRKLTVEAIAAEPTFDELVAQITPENRHEELEWGSPVGREAW